MEKCTSFSPQDIYEQFSTYFDASSITMQQQIKNDVENFLNELLKLEFVSEVL